MREGDDAGTEEIPGECWGVILYEILNQLASTLHVDGEINEV